ncbi:MAG: GNAT family N-acetyltransferase [Bacteroidota bacterium]
MQKKDLKQLVDLCARHAAFEQSTYDSDQKEEQLGKHLFSDLPRLFCLVVEKEHRLIGYATYMKQFSTWDADEYLYMDCLFLTKASRGCGTGEKLMEKIKEEGRKAGCSLIQWQTPNTNKRAMKFYERIGASRKSKERFFLNI